ncbi:MAG: HlyD family secretion protein [Planctomycetota bacterium]
MKWVSFKGRRSSPSGWVRAHVLPILVWVGAVMCVVVLMRHRVRRFEVVGIARGRVHQVAANCAGRLQDVRVQLFGQVSEGQPLAVITTVLDNENLQAQLNTALAGVQQLQAQLATTEETLLAEAANLEADRIAARRRFAVDVENARLRVLEVKTLLETDRIMLEDLDVEVKIVRSLLDEDAVEPYELQKVQVQYNALATKIEENEHLLERATQDFIRAEARRDEFAKLQPQHPSVDSALELIQQATRVQERLVEELLARRVPLVLKAPFDGVVIQVFVRVNDARSLRPGENTLRMPGEVVMPGEPILTIVEAEPAEIIAYAREDQMGRIRERMAVELIKTSEQAQIASSQVVYLGPVMELMPEQLWQNPNIPQWGRPMLIKIPPGFELIPGELVGIRGL